MSKDKPQDPNPDETPLVIEGIALLGAGRVEEAADKLREAQRIQEERDKDHR